MRRLYDSHAQPFARVVYGLPVSWDTYTAATILPWKIQLAAWAPCSKFIAIAPRGSTMIDILDAVTLYKLQSLKFSGGWVYSIVLVFSPDSRMLTSSGHDSKGMAVVSWNLQTGGVAGVIRWDTPDLGSQIYAGYSKNGKTVAVLYYSSNQPSISILDIVSSERMHTINLPQNVLYSGFWAHEESLRFALINWPPAGSPAPDSITIWEVGFSPGVTVTEIETLPIPDVTPSTSHTIRFSQPSTHPQSLLTQYLPKIHPDDHNVVVFDVQTSKVLLHLRGNRDFWITTNSSGGRFFECSIAGSGTHLWKTTPTGYVLHGKLPSHPVFSIPRLSPNGESIIALNYSTIKHWYTKSLAATPSDTFVEPRQTETFLLQLLPHRSLAAVSRRGDSTVTLFDLASGATQLTINTGMEVRGIGITEETVVAISEEKAITWELPGGSFLPGTTINAADSTQTTSFGPRLCNSPAAGLLSPDSQCIIIKDISARRLILCSATTGEYLRDATSLGPGLWFTPDSRSVGFITIQDEGRLLDITTQDTREIAETIDVERGQHGCPYTSPDYKVMDDGWILGPNKERLLIVPPLWRARMWERIWNGQFLGLLHAVLPGAVVFEFPKPSSLRGSFPSSADSSL